MATAEQILKHKASPRFLPSMYLPNGRVNPESIRYYMRVHGFTRDQFVEFLGINVRTLSRWFSGERHPSPMYIVLLDRIIKYTRHQMEQHDGFLPKDKQLVTHLDKRHDPTDEMMIEVFAMTDAVVKRLNEENSRLRTQISGLESALAEERRRKGVTSQDVYELKRRLQELERYTSADQESQAANDA